MNKTWAIMLRELSVTLRRKTFLILALGVPIILGVVAAVLVVVRGGDPPATVPDVSAALAAERVSAEGFVDPGGLVRTLPPDLPAGWLRRFDDTAAADAALAAGTIAGYYLIAADYVASGAISYVTRDYNPVGDSVRSDAMQWVLLVNLLDGDTALAAQAWQPFDVTAQSVAPPADPDDDNWFVEMFPTLMALVLYMVILLPASTLMNAVTDEKKNRVLEVLLTSATPRQFITGKVVALGLLGLLQIGLWFGVLWGVARFGGPALAIPADFVVPTALVAWSVIFALLGYAMYGTLMAGLGALIPDLKDARSGSLLVLAPLIVAYLFMFIVFEVPNGAPALALSFFPLTAPLIMVARMTVTAVPVWQLVLSAALQLAMAVFLVRMVSRLFRAQTLLSGQPFEARRFLWALVGRDEG